MWNCSWYSCFFKTPRKSFKYSCATREFVSCSSLWKNCSFLTPKESTLFDTNAPDSKRPLLLEVSECKTPFMIDERCLLVAISFCITHYLRGSSSKRKICWNHFRLKPTGVNKSFFPVLALRMRLRISLSFKMVLRIPCPFWLVFVQRVPSENQAWRRVWQSILVCQLRMNLVEQHEHVEVSKNDSRNTSVEREIIFSLCVKVCY